MENKQNNTYEYFYINDLLRIFSESFIDFKTNCPRVSTLPVELRKTLDQYKVMENKWNVLEFSSNFEKYFPYIQLNQYFDEFAFCIGDFKLFKDGIVDIIQNEFKRIKDGINTRVIRTEIEMNWYFSFLFDEYKQKSRAVLSLTKNFNSEEVSTTSFWKIIFAFKKINELDVMNEDNYDLWNLSLQNLIKSFVNFEHDPSFREDELGIAVFEINDIIGKLKFLYFQFALIHRIWINQINLKINPEEMAEPGISIYDKDNFSFKFFEDTMKLESSFENKLN
ncbi:hypothetical protein SCHIN_v1c07900 [Spiroplasma chinense]|uniref:Uncharacterized protein n=1 Tax=Spiroplasma chinense TaxID=216932 RepID=A0A5B9Y589_9MOLU|nr:hypothetical protein [Spiroplasma chinense]QEH61985.1 hypothetical protein SCHIN_v1c07900 [Spiroplasma chinense]